LKAGVGGEEDKVQHGEEQALTGGWKGVRVCVCVCVCMCDASFGFHLGFVVRVRLRKGGAGRWSYCREREGRHQLSRGVEEVVQGRRRANQTRRHTKSDDGPRNPWRRPVVPVTAAMPQA